MPHNRFRSCNTMYLEEEEEEKYYCHVQQRRTRDYFRQHFLATPVQHEMYSVFNDNKKKTSFEMTENYVSIQFVNVYVSKCNSNSCI